MTVRELMVELNRCDQDSTVYWFSYNGIVTPVESAISIGDVTTLSQHLTSDGWEEQE